MSSKKKHSGRSLTKLALFDERDKMHPRNETYEGIENFTGLVQKRSKTDLMFLVIYIICNLVAVILFYFCKLFRNQPCLMNFKLSLTRISISCKAALTLEEMLVVNQVQLLKTNLSSFSKILSIWELSECVLLAVQRPW